MSLVENLARRQHRAIDFLHDIEELKRRGYRDGEIADKTGLTREYVRDVLRLLRTGEHRLLRAAETGQIPVSVAVEIAEAKDEEVQAVLQQAYEKKLLRGQKLTAAKRLIEQRRRYGKGKMRAGDRTSEKPLSVERLLRTYKDDTDRKRRLVRKAETTRDCLIFVTEGLRKLLADDNFVTLLRAERLDTLPKDIGDRMRGGMSHE
jgi:ParB family chromosome partitioning protein